MTFKDLRIMPISNGIGRRFVAQHHYAVISPPITKLTLGLLHKGELVGVALWGYGTRPRHTIKKLFPSLDVEDYLELNRLCVLDSMPRNTESLFLRMMARYIREHLPSIKLLYSWADGLRGKPGYVYQASNWLYGGFIWSQFYITDKGEVIHPRLLITRYGTRKKATTLALGLKKIHGYQFRYCKFLCSHKERKRLLKESSVSWSRKYPKHKDLKWVIDAEEGSRESRELPKLQGSGRFRHSAPYFKEMEA
jgi:hypothetical protein